MTKVYEVQMWMCWEYHGNKLFHKKEDAETSSKMFNSIQKTQCLKDKCCFSRVKEKEVE